MAHHTKKITILTLVLIAIVFMAATIGPYKKYKNLQVLPQDISRKQLDSIMNAYGKALKVSCDFCHVKPKKDMFSIATSADTLDYSLDNSMKEEARKMIKMTIGINKNNFYFDSTKRPEYLNVVSCNTCHRGNPSPINE
jgi:hypothetical protein